MMLLNLFPAEVFSKLYYQLDKHLESIKLRSNRSRDGQATHSPASTGTGPAAEGVEAHNQTETAGWKMRWGDRAGKHRTRRKKSFLFCKLNRGLTWENYGIWEETAPHEAGCP